MRFHRNIKMLRGQLDAAPFIMVFFLVLIFVLLGSLTYTPGVHVRLPVAEGFPGTANPTVSVAVDPQGRIYFQNQLVDETELGKRLAHLSDQTPGLLTLMVHADRDVTYDTLVRVTQLARDSGIENALLATLPRLYPDSATTSQPSNAGSR
jgi:biopolymer transport protein ExbD